MSIKKVFKAGLISATILTLSTATAFSAGPEVLKPINNTELLRPINSELIRPINNSEQVNGVLPIFDFDGEPRPNYQSFSGIIKEINDHHSVPGAKFVWAISEDGREANMVLLEEAYIIDNAQLEVGAVITGFYNANLPMIMIYPPQYKLEVVAINADHHNIKVDYFDGNLVNQDNTLKLNISDETEIILEDGSKFTGDLTDKKLVVFYGVTTRSIPAQTTPSKVIVLADLEPKMMGLAPIAVSETVVNGEPVEAPEAYTNDAGVLMVPLRAIAEALGLGVSWNGELQAIAVGQDIALKIGEDKYVSGENNAIKLGASPELKEGTTFVPLSFFREVVGLNNAYSFEGQIVVDNGELMY